MADALASGASVGNYVEVRLLSAAPVTGQEADRKAGFLVTPI